MITKNHYFTQCNACILHHRAGIDHRFKYIISQRNETNDEPADF